MNRFWTWYDEYASHFLHEREPTFTKMFRYLDQFQDPVIIETGCTLTDEMPWGTHGCSTILFDTYVACNGGQFHSVDIDEARADKARELCAYSHDGTHTQIICANSIDFLHAYDGPSPHLLYLDSMDVDWSHPLVSQMHHLNELMAVLPKITSKTLVVVDDSPTQFDDKGNMITLGKGGLIGQYADTNNVPKVFTHYQSGWLGFNG